MTNKEIAITFLKQCAAGDSFEAFAKFTSPAFKHHNAHFKGDANTLKTAMAEAAKQHPDKVFYIKMALEDGELVSIHSHVILKDDHPGYAVSHILKFENYKIIEMWDFGQEIPENSVNENGIF